MEQTEKQIQSNAEFEVFTVDGKACKTSVLVILSADAWLDKADLVDEAYDKVAKSSGKKKSDARRAYVKALSDCVLSYNPDWPKDLAKKVSSQQLVKAFRMLRAITDPFEYETSEQSREVKERLAGIPPQILTQAMSVTPKP